MAKVFVGNFSFTVDDDQLKAYFAQVGEVLSAKVMREPLGGKSRGFGFVEFGSEDLAAEAIQKLDGSNWDGRTLKVSQDRSGRRNDYNNDRGGFGDDGRPREQLGYFRAQPLDLGLKRKKRPDPFLENKDLAIDYKDAKLLRRFMSERGRMFGRRSTGLTAMHQRQVTRAIKRAQQLALLPYVGNE